MVTKNLIISSLTFASAVASAMATTNVNQYSTAWINVLYHGATNYVCEDTGFHCNINGPLPCTIYVETINGAISVPGQSESSCVYTLNETSNAPIGVYYPSSGIIIAAN